MIVALVMKIISASYMITIPSGNCVVENGAMLVNGEKIEKIGTRNELEKNYPKAEKEYYDNAVLMPGLISAYSHPELATYREAGRTPSDPILLDAMVLENKKELSPAIAQQSAKLEIKRWIKSGITCMGAAVYHPGIYTLAKSSGIRAVVMPEITGGAVEDTQDVFETAIALAEEHESKGRVRSGIAPLSGYLLSRPMLSLAAEHAKRSDYPLYIKASASFAEMEFFFNSEGPIASTLFPKLGWTSLPSPHHQTPIQFLSEVGVFNAKTAIVGGTQLAGRDFNLLARNGVRVVWCPRLSQVCNSGQFPWGKLITAGIPVALGCDDWLLPEGDIWQEMRSAKTKDASDITPTSKDLLCAATMGGARALRIEDEVGSLEEGKKADYIIVRKPLNENIFDGLVDETNPSSIICVAVDGKTLDTKK